MLSEPRQEIEKLVANYQSLSPRERKRHNEANTRDGFVQPLFEALGWDFSGVNQVEAEQTIIKRR